MSEDCAIAESPQVSRSGRVGSVAKPIARASKKCAGFAVTLVRRMVTTALMAALSWWLMTGGAATIAGWAQGTITGEAATASESRESAGPVSVDSAIKALTKSAPALGVDPKSLGAPKIRERGGRTYFTWQVGGKGESKTKVTVALDSNGHPVDFKASK